MTINGHILICREQAAIMECLDDAFPDPCSRRHNRLDDTCVLPLEITFDAVESELKRQGVEP